MSFELPSNNAVVGTAGHPSTSWLSWFNSVHQTVTAARQSGPTAARPTKVLWVGRRYFDTTLNKPVWVSGVSGGSAVWVDATGATV